MGIITTLLNVIYQEREIKDNPDMRLSFKHWNNMKQVIDKLYNEYQTFMCIAEDDIVSVMPDYEVYFKQYKRDFSLAAVEYECNRNAAYNK